MCKDSEPLKQAELLVAAAVEQFTEIEKFNRTLQVKGRGYCSKDELDLVTEGCANVWQFNKALDDYLKAIKALCAIPTKTG